MRFISTTLNLEWENFWLLKFSFSEKATKMSTIVLMVLTSTKGQMKPKADWRAVDSPKKRTNDFLLLFAFLGKPKPNSIRTIAHIFVAFSEKLNFKAQ